MNHWMKAFNPNYLGAYAFQEREEKVVVIRSVGMEEITNSEGGKENKLVARFTGEEKPLILNKTNSRTIAKLYKNPDMDTWPGEGLILYVAKVPAFGELVDAVRIRPVKPFECADCHGYITGCNGRSHGEIRQYTKEKYGRQLCPECAAKAAEKGG